MKIQKFVRCCVMTEHNQTDLLPTTQNIPSNKYIFCIYLVVTGSSVLVHDFACEHHVVQGWNGEMEGLAVHGAETFVLSTGLLESIVNVLGLFVL